ncbi:hypothetical protein Q757_03365 [Oenococcus alcoholitolerans]|uniref:Uncharacterized protein n=1 Tax=Oenococcus alcoholitolerans TaxID=931074 RepID=A0ABR4XRE2_9LACO|nr:hypothetical protein Q757_03365 [Oenococcus alcoholitolerans]
MSDLLGKTIPNLQPYNDPKYFVYLIIFALPIIVGLFLVVV